MINNFSKIWFLKSSYFVQLSLKLDEDEDLLESMLSIFPRLWSNRNAAMAKGLGDTALWNRKFSSYLVPLYKNESTCETIHMKMFSTHKFNSFSHHTKGFAQDSFRNRGNRQLGNCRLHATTDREGDGRVAGENKKRVTKVITRIKGW